MADNVSVTAGAGTTIAADEVNDAGLGVVKVQYVKLMDGTADGTTKAGVGANGLAVSATQNGTWTITANAGTNLNTSALALDATLTNGTQKAIARGGAKGATTAADITGTAEGTDHQALDVQIYHSGAAVNPANIRALASGTDSVTTVPSGTQTITGTVTANAGTNLNTSALALDTSITALTSAVNTLLKPANTLTKVTTVDTITNPVTVQQFTGTNLHTVVDSGSVVATRSDGTGGPNSITAQDTSSITQTLANGQVRIINSPTAGSAAQFGTSSSQTFFVTVGNSWSGTLVTEVTYDNGSSWFPTDCRQVGTTFSASSFTQNFVGSVNVAGAQLFRVRSTAAMTGTADVSISRTYNVSQTYMANVLQAQNTTTTLSNVTSSASNVTLLAANTNRKTALFFNDSTANLFLKFGATASATSFTVKMTPASFFEMPTPCYTGIIDGIWASANGACRVTELI